MVSPVHIGSVAVGAGAPLVLIAGPCVLESDEQAHDAATAIAGVAAAAGLEDRVVLKASFDKANRTRGDSFRGLGLEAGLRLLATLRERYGMPVLTDVHEPHQAEAAAEVVDALQVPAFLCRQTDLLAACGRTGKPTNIKKGQFLAPEDLAFAVQKLGPDAPVLLTERGTFFGYRDLVVDFRSLIRMRALGAPVVYDVTHSVQRPGAGSQGGVSGGDRRFALPLARAAVAVGVDALYVEVHPRPAEARSDRKTQLAPSELAELLAETTRIAGSTQR